MQGEEQIVVPRRADERLLFGIRVNQQLETIKPKSQKLNNKQLPEVEKNTTVQEKRADLNVKQKAAGRGCR